MDFLIKFKAFFKGKETFDLRKALEEKRFHPRARCFVEAIAIPPRKKELPVIITEVSISGIRLSSEKAMKPGEIVDLRALKSGGQETDGEPEAAPVKMKVVWNRRKPNSREYLVGLHYADNMKNLQDSWVAALLKNYGVSVGLVSTKRKKVRIPVDLPLSMTVGSEFIKGSVKDLGIGGMLIESDKNINVKDKVKFRVGPYKHLQSFSCEGKLTHKRFIPSTKKWIYGALFLEMSEKQANLLSTYLTTLCTELMA